MSSIQIDCSTGEVTERPLTPEEEAERDQIRAEGEAQALEQAWAELYQERSLRLSGTDWLVEPFPTDMPDNVQNECRQYEAEWRAYRQALRDLPEQTADPANPVWPTPPPAPLLAVTPQPEALAQRR